MDRKDNVISIRNLTVNYVSKEIGTCEAVNDFSLDIRRGETVGLVGETGAGKTTVALEHHAPFAVSSRENIERRDSLQRRRPTQSAQPANAQDPGKRNHDDFPGPYDGA